MTQHDETGTATGQPEPAPSEAAPPSPYLDSGGSLPQAYLAPPQPGQPKYGTPAAFGPGQWQSGPGRQATRSGATRSGATRSGATRSGAAGRQAFGQSGYRQSGYGQPGYGRPATARGAFGPQERRDPALAAPWERLVATILDWIIIFAVATAAFIAPLLQIWRQLQAVATQYPNLNSPDAQAAIDAIIRNPSNQRALLVWFLAMFGFALVYYWLQHAAWGATIGKRALGTRVVAAADHSAIGIRAAGIRAVVFLAGPAAFMILAYPLNIPGGLLWLVDTGLPLLDSRARCLHDKLAGTIVIRQRWLDQQARSARTW